MDYVDEDDFGEETKTKSVPDCPFDFEAEIDAQNTVWQETFQKQMVEELGVDLSYVGSSFQPGTNRGYFSQVCKHWLKDMCMKREKCQFMHHLDHSRMPECSSFMKWGKCNDKNCMMKHPLDKAECLRYKYGFCKLGPLCKLRHDRLPRSELPAIVPDWFLKEIIENVFEHVPRLPEELLTGVKDSSGGEAAGSPRAAAGYPMPGMVPAPPGYPIMQQPQLHVPGVDGAGAYRFFVMHASDSNFVAISNDLGVWASQPKNTEHLASILMSGAAVVLFVKDLSQHTLVGYMQMTSLPDPSLHPKCFGAESSRLSPNFTIRWVKKCTIDSRQLEASLLIDPNNPQLGVIGTCRDGQQVSTASGMEMIRVLVSQPDVVIPPPRNVFRAGTDAGWEYDGKKTAAYAKKRPAWQAPTSSSGW